MIKTQNFEINQGELMEMVRNISLREECTELKYRGREYFINFLSKDSSIEVAGNNPAFMQYRTEICVRDWISKIRYPEFAKYKNAIAFHEIIEADLINNQKLSVDKAHRIANMCDRAFARKTMDTETFAEYEAFRERVSTQRASAA